MLLIIIASIIGFYLIGVLLNYLRMAGFVYNLEEKSREKYEYSIIGKIIEDRDDVLFLSSSWIGFIVGIEQYFKDKERYFFKLSLYSLRKKYPDGNL